MWELAPVWEWTGKCGLLLVTDVNRDMRYEMVKAELLIFFCFLCKKNGHRKRRINNGLKGIKAKTGWERDTAIGKELKSPFQTDYTSENKGDPQTRFQWYLTDLVNSRVDGRVKTGKRSNSQKNCQLIAKSSRLMILVLIQGKILEHIIKWLLCELWEGEETNYRVSTSS